MVHACQAMSAIKAAAACACSVARAGSPKRFGPGETAGLPPGIASAAELLQAASCRAAQCSRLRSAAAAGCGMRSLKADCGAEGAPDSAPAFIAAGQRRFNWGDVLRRVGPNKVVPLRRRLAAGSRLCGEGCWHILASLELPSCRVVWGSRAAPGRRDASGRCTRMMCQQPKAPSSLAPPRRHPPSWRRC